MMFDLPHPFGPTTPTSCPGTWKLVGSTKDLNPDNLMEDRRTFSRKDGCREKPHHTICSLLYGQDSASLFTLGARDVLINFSLCGVIDRPLRACGAHHHETSKSNCYDMAIFSAMLISQYC
jgi:hypothetical protein